MKPLAHNEIFQNLSGFLKARGIELKEGSYAHGIKKSCALLTNAINLSQESLERAKTEVEKSVDHMRQVIHEKTAPKAPPVQTAGAPCQPETKATPAATATKEPGKAKPQTKKKAKRTRPKGRG